MVDFSIILLHRINFCNLKCCSKKNQSINQQQAPVYFTTATICLACYNSCAYITQVFSFQRGTIILQRQTVEGIPSNGMFSKSLAYPSVRQIVKFTLTYNCSTENSIGLFIPSSLSIFHLNFYRQYQRSCHKARTYLQLPLRQCNGVPAMFTSQCCPSER